MLRILVLAIAVMSLLAACDKSGKAQNKNSVTASAAQSRDGAQKVAENRVGDDEQLIEDNNIEEPTGDAIDKAEHDDEADVEVDMD